MLTRAQIIAALARELEAESSARAAWLGGSDATGRADALSDIDLVVIARDEAVKPIMQRLEGVMEQELRGIALKLIVPQPSWHGHEQGFYRLADAEPEHMVDLVVIRESAPPHSRFLEVERHGRGTILFDRDGILTPPPMDRDGHHAKLRDRLAALKLRFEMFQVLVTKAIARKQPVDGLAFYHSWTLLPLVEALRMRYCPDRYDYGLRYLQDDLPPDVYDAVERLSYHVNVEALAAHHAEVVTLFRQTLQHLDAAR